MIIKESKGKINRSNNVRKTKWSFLNWNPPRTKESYEKTLIVAASYFKEEILTDLMNKKIIKKGETPTRKNVIEGGHHSFISAIDHRKLSYNSILKIISLKLNRLNEEWNFLNWDNKGKLISKKQIIEKAKDYLIKHILTEDFKLGFGLRENEAPTRQNLIDSGYKNFVSAIYNRKLSYNEILRKAELKLNLDKEKYKNFNWSITGIPRTKDQALENAKTYFLNNILNDKFRSKYHLGEGEAPSTELKNKNFVNFLWRGLYVRNLSYNDLLEKLGLLPHKGTVFSKVGRLFHWIAERIFLQHTKNKCCYSFYEVYPNRFGKSGSRNHCDNSIIVEENFRNLTKFSKKIPEDIKIINIDYYLGTSEKYSRMHCMKGYQDKNKLLLLVPINAQKQLKIPLGIPYKHRVKILDPNSFIDFFGYKEKLYDDFINSIDLAKKSTYSKNHRKTLEELSLINKRIIKTNYNFSQNELEDYLKSNLDFLKCKSDKSSIEFFL